MVEAAVVELRQEDEPYRVNEPVEPPAEQTKVSDDIGDATPPKPKDKKADPDEFEIRRREFFGL